jgi:hypothetical protein
MVHQFCSVLIVSLLVNTANGRAGTLRKIWELNLETLGLKQDQHHTSGLPVFALRFSPDNQHIAAVVDWYKFGGEDKSNLLVLQTLHPDVAVRNYKINAGIDEDEDSTDLANFGWSPSGEIVYAGGAVIHLGDGKVCSLPYMSTFTAENRAIGRDSADAGPSRSWDRLVSHFSFFNAACEEQEKWEVKEEWHIRDVSTDRGLLSVSRIVALPNTLENLIVDVSSRKVLHRWRGDEASGEFADGGKAICNGSDVETADRAPVTCWEVDTGVKIAVAPTVSGGFPIRSSLHASRIVASDYRRRKIPFSNEYSSALKCRVVWDFRTGKEIASWNPDFQSYRFRAISPPKQVNEPFRFAISPDGQYVLEGGNGILRLYRIEP